MSESRRDTTRFSVSADYRAQLKARRRRARWRFWVLVLAWSGAALWLAVGEPSPGKRLALSVLLPLAILVLLAALRFWSLSRVRAGAMVSAYSLEADSLALWDEQGKATLLPLRCFSGWRTVHEGTCPAIALVPAARIRDSRGAARVVPEDPGAFAVRLRSVLPEVGHRPAVAVLRLALFLLAVLLPTRMFAELPNWPATPFVISLAGVLGAASLVPLGFVLLVVDPRLHALEFPQTQTKAQDV